MHPSWTLSRYIGRQFLLTILATLLALIAVATLIDIVELLRRTAEHDNVPFRAVLTMSLFKAPSLSEKLMPFAVLIGSIVALTRLTRSQELIVARAAGVSVWQFLTPALATAVLFGLVMTMVFNPLASTLLLRYERLEGKYLSGKPSLIAVSPSGLWLRQVEQKGKNPEAKEGVKEYIIYSLRMSQSDLSFANVIIFAFDQQYRFGERLDAERAVLEPGVLHLYGVTRSRPGERSEQLGEYMLPTTLKLAHIQDSFASPETISFWQLPSFITVLEKAGFSALRHRLYWHSLLATPVLFSGMVLIAAVFSLRLPRRGKIGALIVAGVGTGFMLHFFTDIIGALGMAGSLPVQLAAWAPALAILMVGTGTLLHLEDG